MLAEELIGVHEKSLTVPAFTTRHAGLTARAGYAAAHALHKYRLSKGWKPIGRKIGFTNRTLWERYGVHEPMWGTVYDRTLIQAENQRATVPLEGLVQPRIEPEIAFKLKSVPGNAYWTLVLCLGKSGLLRVTAACAQHRFVMQNISSPLGLR